MQRSASGGFRSARSTWAAVAAAFALAVGFSGVALQAARAEASFPIYDEGDSPNPFDATNALVFYKAADLGWKLNAPDGVPIADVETLNYTIANSTSYAPSFQLVTQSDQKSYARVVWEPYQQNPAVGPNEGAFTDLQDGVWWTNKIASGDGSQASPQPLSFFADGGGAGWTNVVVSAIDVHQGSTTEATSLLTKVTYNGTDVPLGTQATDSTPFDQSDIDDAVAAFASTHHTADGTFIGESRLVLKATPEHGKSIGVNLTGKIATATDLHYKWFLDGNAVSGATNPTYTVPSNATGKGVSVHVTGAHDNIVVRIHSNTLKAK